ncbi:MAG: hypothetical protein ACRER7_05355, partial [Gammaproteobacteria bacterium]
PQTNAPGDLRLMNANPQAGSVNPHLHIVIPGAGFDRLSCAKAAAPYVELHDYRTPRGHALPDGRARGDEHPH